MNSRQLLSVCLLVRPLIDNHKNCWAADIETPSGLCDGVEVFRWLQPDRECLQLR